MDRSPARAPRTAAPRTRTATLVAASVFCSMVALGFSYPSGTPSGDSALPVLGLGASIVVAWLVARRHRSTTALALTSSAFAVALGGDVLGGLVAVYVLAARRRLRQEWYLVVAVAVAAGVWVLRDAARPPAEQLWSVTSSGGEVVGQEWWFAAALWLVCVGAPLGLGLYRASRTSLARATEAGSLHADRAASLARELSRQEERDALAREVHDVLAHRLALISLQSGALRAATTDDDTVRAVAESLRVDAHSALEDLRELIGVLRSGEPLGEEALPPAASSFAGLSELLAASRRAGSAMVATVVVTDGQTASATLARAVYRIVQEALTNVHKHAPRGEVELSLEASPESGVRIVVDNPIASTAGGPAVPHGSGSGTSGIRERAALLHGTATVGPVEGRYVVDVWLPWQPSPRTSEPVVA
ncbi:sensor histidine kinase [Flavimobilis marinus]|nr:histidine kinase [Flavimobilis marinus]